MKQTGFIPESPKPEAWLMGGETGIGTLVRVEDGNWNKPELLPAFERQSRTDQFSFDSMSCVTFAGLNTIEGQLKFMLKQGQIPEDVLNQLNILGYIENGEFQFSDRFTAIMSGTTKQGNTLTKVWDSIRQCNSGGWGLLPEKDLPFGGNSFEEYHNKKLITPAMKAKAKIILGFFDFKYDWIITSSKQNDKKIREALETCPIHGGFTGHSIDILNWSGNPDYLDTYEPFIKSRPASDFIFGLRGVVSLKNRRFPIWTFVNDLYEGLKNDEVIILQQILKTLGLLSVNATGQFGPSTKQAVIDFQYAYGIKGTGYVGPLTRKVLNDICSYDSAQGEPDVDPPLVEVMSDWVKSWFKK